MRPSSCKYADLEGLSVYLYPPPSDISTIAKPKIHFHIPTYGGAPGTVHVTMYMSLSDLRSTWISSKNKDFR